MEPAKAREVLEQITSQRIYIEAGELDELLLNGPCANMVILDIRNADAFQAVRIRYSWNLPWDQISVAMKSIPQDKTLLLVCNTGQRASLVGALLTLLGYRIAILHGGISEYIDLNGAFLERSPVKKLA
ncbi:rhodanese-like domain-containing protein [Moorella sulfitireducens]|uniref:rhodanese-like domain-containing protein n=1 Tax=Neomoorella sulfitireducens TaxID=2972948 RepID=UPI0021AC86E0